MNTNKVARGGTELMAARINSLPPELLSKFQITHSRVRGLDKTKKQIYLLHDLPGDPEVEHLRNGGWQKFDKLVFVSHWQQQMYNLILGVPYSAGTVLQNAIDPCIASRKESSDVCRLIYFSTPHRGLNILSAAFKELRKEFGQRIELSVFSSFDLYGWEERDKPFGDLFRELTSTKGVTYSKSVSNSRIRSELLNHDVLAYPSIWPETSCLVLIESMCHGLKCVHSSLAALPETSLGLTNIYTYDERPQVHLKVFVDSMRSVVYNHLEGKSIPPYTMQIANDLYSWEARSKQWTTLLDNIWHGH
jgi:glycosyltransferase involved in cell wall biosynthesis